MPIIAVGATGRFSVSRLRRRLAGPTLAQNSSGPAHNFWWAAPSGVSVAGAGAQRDCYELHIVPPAAIRVLREAPDRQIFPS